MDPMPLVVTWSDLALRLFVTFAASLLIGLNRGQHGEPAGLRTTILVGMAAAVAMIQANVLLPTAGKEPGFFSVLDLMRLPLGILAGMGFIGGGAILRRGNLVLGVTTAATLWFVTVIGLCFGGGQLVLGVAATGICLTVLWALKAFEAYIPQDAVPS
jgi:putative Mg2+ transporter-C (MgtC) family protein